MAKHKVGAAFAVAESKLETRFRWLAQTLNDELNLRDQRLSFVAIPDRKGAVLWRLVNQGRSATEDGILPNIADTLATSEAGTALQFGLTEQWSRKSKTTFEFKACNLRFAIVNVARGLPPVLFRLEWAGREISPVTGELVFPGRGAAHPHWQFDTNMHRVEADSAQSGIATEEVVSTDLVLENTEDLTSLLVAPDLPAPRDARSYSWFHKLHLPAKAMWSTTECVMPDQADAQQHEPTDIDDLNKWVVSALRYLRHEFEIYSN